MNILETYVTNIKSVKEIDMGEFKLYALVCDTDCYGSKKYGTSLLLSERNYENVKQMGYYLG